MTFNEIQKAAEQGRAGVSLKDYQTVINAWEERKFNQVSAGNPIPYDMKIMIEDRLNEMKVIK